MYYHKYNSYIIGFGCVCILIFLMYIFINPSDSNKGTKVAAIEVTNKDEPKKNLDDLSQKLVTIRQELLKQEENEKRSTR